MSKRTKELIEILRRVIALCHEESGAEDVRGSQIRKEMAKQLRGMHAIHAKYAQRPLLETLRYTLKIFDGTDHEFRIS